MDSIQNQLWHSFNTSQANTEMLKEKLNSIPDHLCNIHKFSENKYYKECEHGPLPPEGRAKVWCSPESPVSNIRLRYKLKVNFQAIPKVMNILHGFQNCRFDDLEHMVEFTHTGELGEY